MLLVNIRADLDIIAKLHLKVASTIEDVEFYNNEKQDD
jgi:hypothetical protein